MIETGEDLAVVVLDVKQIVSARCPVSLSAGHVLSRFDTEPELGSW